jgi:hypothetical protein
MEGLARVTQPNAEQNARHFIVRGSGGRKKNKNKTKQTKIAKKIKKERTGELPIKGITKNGNQNHT